MNPIFKVLRDLVPLTVCFYALTGSEHSVWAAVAFRMFMDFYFDGKLVQINAIQE